MIGATLGPYRITAELGSGGMGAVYRATVETAADGLAPGTEVAVKVVHAHLLGRPGFLERFAREAEIGKRVVHPNVVRTLDAGGARVGGAEVRYLVMEYVEGQTLRALADELGRAPEELCRHVGREVAKGLAAIHAAGIVHRDVKPENALITKDHVVKVMDLGVARLEGESLSQTGAFVGSLRYAAPEQIENAGRGVDGRADLHALGLVLYELATATHPFPADDVPGAIDKILHATPRRAGEVHPQLSLFFEELLAHLLEKDRTLRPASAEDVARILDEGEESAWWKERATAIRARTRRPLRRIRIPRETALHGREAELATLHALYERAARGEGAVLLLEGEAGIGKSRLLDEFVGVLERRGEELHCLVGGYPPGGAATSSGAFSTAYREHFGAEGSSKWLAPTPILVPAFDALLRGEPAPAGTEPLRKDSLQTCFVHATRALAKDRTTIVLIDDLHFAPQEGRELFAALALAVPGHRVLLVGTTRPGLDERWTVEIDRIGAARLALPRLGAPDLVRLLADSLRSQHLAEELAGKIAVKSDGNPFFVFEILRGLREGQFLTRSADGAWVTTQVIRNIEIPSSIRDLVEARVSDLDDASRNLLDVAACIGCEFDARIAASVLGIGRIPALQALGRIEKRHRLVHAVGDRFVFDHHQVQETLHDALSKPLREEYHAAIAETIEARSGAAAKEPKDLDGARCVELAGHFLGGGAGLRAMRYLEAALTHLERNYLNEAAVALARRALAAPGLLAGRERCELLLREADRLDHMADHAACREAIDEAVPLADATSDPALRARTRLRLARYLHNVAHQEAAVAAFEETITLARGARDAATERDAVLSLGVAEWVRGRYAESRALYERAVALARESGDRRAEGFAASCLADTLWVLGEYAAARVEAEHALALARETGNRHGERAAIVVLGNLAWVLGRTDEARGHFERCIALAREIGDRRAEANANGNLSNAFWSSGRYEETRVHDERYAALAREAGYAYGESVALLNQGELLRTLGRSAEARSRLDRGLAVARQGGFGDIEGKLLHAAASLADDAGDAAAAERLFADALARLEPTGDGKGIAATVIALGALLARQGRTDEARARFDEAEEIGRRLDEPQTALLAAAHLAALPGGAPGAALGLLAARRTRLDHGVKMEVCWLLAKSAGDPAHLAEAKRLLDFAVEHAPPDCRGTMLANVRVHREIAAAARAAGPAR